MKFLIFVFILCSHPLWAQVSEMEELENIDEETGTSQKRIDSSLSDDHEELKVEPQNQDEDEDSEEEFNDDDG